MYCTNLSKQICIFDLTLYSFQNHCTKIDQYEYKNCLQCKGVFRGERGGGGGGGLGHPFLNFFDPPLVYSRFLSARNNLFNKTLTLPKRILRANKSCIVARSI